MGLVLDEIELILPDLEPETINRYLAFDRTLRGIVQENGNLSIVVAGVSAKIRLINRIGDKQNPFYQFFEPVFSESIE